MLPALSRDDLAAAKFSLGMAVNLMFTPGYLAAKALFTAWKPASDPVALETTTFRSPFGVDAGVAAPGVVLCPLEQPVNRATPSTDAVRTRMLRGASTTWNFLFGMIPPGVAEAFRLIQKYISYGLGSMAMTHRPWIPVDSKRRN